MPILLRCLAVITKRVRFMYEVCINAEAPSLSIIDCVNKSVTSASTDKHEKITSMNDQCIYISVVFSFKHIAESSGASQMNTYENNVVHYIVQQDTSDSPRVGHAMTSTRS